MKGLEWVRGRLDGPGFWIMLACAGVAFAIVGLYVVNHNAIVRNQQLLREHRTALERSNQAIEYLCETNQTLDLLVQQFIDSGEQTLRTLKGPARANYRKQVTALQTTHLVLSDSRACRKVTG